MSGQSRVFKDYSSTLEVKQGTTKALMIELDMPATGVLYDTITDPEGGLLGIRLKVWKPDGTILINRGCDPTIDGTTVSSVTANVTAEDNSEAGNWAGEIEFVNSEGTPLLHSYTFNYNIIRTF